MHVVSDDVFDSFADKDRVFCVGRIHRIAMPYSSLLRTLLFIYSID